MKSDSTILARCLYEQARIRISQPPRVTSEIVESDIMSIPVLIPYDVLP